jgi:hypothetical protein
LIIGFNRKIPNVVRVVWFFIDHYSSIAVCSNSNQLVIVP